MAARTGGFTTVWTAGKCADVGRDWYVSYVIEDGDGFGVESGGGVGFMW